MRGRSPCVGHFSASRFFNAAQNPSSRSPLATTSIVIQNLELSRAALLWIDVYLINREEPLRVTDSFDAEQHLVQAAIDGDAAAFEELIRRTGRLVFAQLYLETGNVHEAEDLSQETFIAAFRQIRRLENPAAFRPWLLRIAHTVMLDAVRRSSRLKRNRDASPAPPASSPPDPLVAAATHDSCRKVLSVLRSMPAEYRQPLMLRYLADADYATIGRELGLSNGSLRGLLHRGMALLRDRLNLDETGAPAMTRHTPTPLPSPHLDPEQIDALIAGGLTDAERAAAAAHLASCPACIAVLTAATAADQKVRTMLTPAHPAAGFEDRLIDAVRGARSRRLIATPTVRRAALGGRGGAGGGRHRRDRHQCALNGQGFPWTSRRASNREPLLLEPAADWAGGSLLYPQ